MPTLASIGAGSRLGGSQLPLGPMNPEEEEEWLNYVLGGGATALQSIGNILDTIGGPLRTLAVKGPSQALQSIFDPSKRVRGEEIAQNLGLTTPGSWGSLLGGAAIEILTDPLTYASFGASALSKTGRAAEKAGLLSKQLPFNKVTGRLLKGPREFKRTTTLGDLAKGATADQLASLNRNLGGDYTKYLDEVLGKDVRFGVPFTNMGAEFNLPGQLGLKYAKLKDRFGEGLRASVVGRAWAKAFDPDVRGIDIGGFGESGQRALAAQRGAKLTSQTIEQKRAEAGVAAAELSAKWRDLGVDTSQPAQAEALRMFMESQSPISKTKVSVEQSARENLSWMNQEQLDEAYRLRAIEKTELSKWQQERLVRGLHEGKVDETEVPYHPRLRTDKALQNPKAPLAMDTREPRGSRNPKQAFTPGGTVTGHHILNDLDVDARLRAIPEQDYLRPATKQQLDTLAELFGDDSGVYEDLAVDLEDLTKWQAEYMIRAAKAASPPAPGVIRSTGVPLPHPGRVEFGQGEQMYTLYRDNFIKHFGYDQERWQNAVDNLRMWKNRHSTTSAMRHTNYQQAFDTKDLAQVGAKTMATKGAGFVKELQAWHEAAMEKIEGIAGKYGLDVVQEVDPVTNIPMVRLRAGTDEISISLPPTKKFNPDTLWDLWPQSNPHELRRMIGELDKASGELAKNAGLGRPKGLMPEEIELLQAQNKQFVQHLKSMREWFKDARAIDANVKGMPDTGYGNSTIYDAAIKKQQDMEMVAWHDSIARAIIPHLTAHSDMGAPADSYTLNEVLKKIAGNSWNHADNRIHQMRWWAKELAKGGKVSKDVYENMTGPHAVYATGLKPHTEAARAYEKANQALGRVDDLTSSVDSLRELANEIARPDRDLAKITAGLVDIEQRLGRVPNPTGGRGPLSQLNRTVRAIHKHLDRAAAKNANATKYGGLTVSEREYIKSGQKIQKLLGKLGDPQQYVDEANDALAKVDKAALQPVYDGLLSVNRLYAPKDLVDSLFGVFDQVRDPQSTKWWTEIYDKFLNVTKAGLTVPWFGFHFRNLYNLGWQHLAADGHDPRFSKLNPRSWTKSWEDMSTILNGGTLKDAKELFPDLKLTNEQATLKLRAEMSGFNVATGKEHLHSQAADIVGVSNRQQAVQDLTGRLPGSTPRTPLYPLQEFGRGLAGLFSKDGWKPWKVLGGWAEEGDQLFAPYAAGRNISDYLESLGRGATYIAKRRQGYAPEVASALANAAHVRYDKLSSFERKVMKRVLPFYVWARGMTPWVVRDLMNNPGGLNAQAIRTLNKAGEDEGGWLPPEIRQSLGIKLGGPDDKGIQSYLTGVDLPFEVLNDYLRLGGGIGDTAQQTLRTTASQTVPWGRFLIEEATGQSLYRGRDIQEEKSRLGKLVGNITGQGEPAWDNSFLERMLMSTIGAPVSRAINTAAQATDTSRGLAEWATRVPINTLTGARIRHVDVEKAKDYDVLQGIQKQAKGQSPFVLGEYVTVPAEKVPEMTPEQVRLLQLYRSRSKSLQERRRAEGK